MKYLFLLCTLLHSFTSAYAQITDFFGNEVNQEICNQLAFTNKEEAQTALNNICSAAGIKNIYVIMPCSNIGNCYATHRFGKPYILYDPLFLGKIQAFGFTEKNLPKMNTNWGELTILAHELGHHVRQHFTTPDISQKYSLNELELQADEFAGRIMFKLGATLQQAQKVMYNQFVQENAGESHPSRTQRLAAIKKGYEDQQNEERPPVIYSASTVIANISLRAYVDKNDDKVYANGRQVAYHYYMSGKAEYLDQIREVRYVRNHATFYEYQNDLYQSSQDRPTKFDFKGYQWGWISDTYVTVVLKDGSISPRMLKAIHYDQ